MELLWHFFEVNWLYMWSIWVLFDVCLYEYLFLFYLYLLSYTYYSILITIISLYTWCPTSVFYLKNILDPLHFYMDCGCWVMSESLRPHGLWPARLLCPWNSPGKNTVVGSLSLLQGIFLTQGSNPGLLNCRVILYRLSYHDFRVILSISTEKTSWDYDLYYLKSYGSHWKEWTLLECNINDEYNIYF